MFVTFAKECQRNCICLAVRIFFSIRSLISYTRLAWWHSQYSKKNVFTAKKVITIISGINNRGDCKDKVTSLNILTTTSIFIQHCLMHVKQIEDIYAHRYQIHRNMLNCEGMKFCCELPLQMKSLDQWQVKMSVKKFLVRNAFQNLDDFWNFDFTKYLLL